MTTVNVLEKSTPAIVLFEAMCKAGGDDILSKFNITPEGGSTTVDVHCTINGVEVDIESTLIGYFEQIDGWVNDRAMELVKERVGTVRLENISQTLSDLARAVEDLSNYPMGRVEFEIENWLKENRK